MGRTSGCSRRTEGGPSGWPTSSVEHRVLVMTAPQKSSKPFCGKFIIVNELFVSHTPIYVCDHRTNNLCMHPEIIVFPNFSVKFTLSLYFSLSVYLWF